MPRVWRSRFRASSVVSTNRCISLSRYQSLPPRRRISDEKKMGPHCELINIFIYFSHQITWTYSLAFTLLMVLIVLNDIITIIIITVITSIIIITICFIIITINVAETIISPLPFLRTWNKYTRIPAYLFGPTVKEGKEPMSRPRDRSKIESADLFRWRREELFILKSIYRV